MSHPGVMAISDRLPPWWDRDIDEETGRALRADVRNAAHRVWRWVCRKAQEVLGDSSDAAEVLESSVRTISRYLDKSNVPLHSTDPGGLLVLACYRSLRRLARRRRRYELVGGTSELAEILEVPDWRDEIDRRLFLDELARELDTRSSGILRLRLAGYDWNEIGRMMHMSTSAVRRSFWRGVRKGYFELLRVGKATRPDEW